ncbi:hypothetical protein CR513_51711, partial [Mucuna pruriens]
MEGTATHEESNKENIPLVCTQEESNIPPVCTKGEKKKNSIPPMTPSFKRNCKRKMKRVPLADITNLVNNSAHDPNEVSALPSASKTKHMLSSASEPKQEKATSDSATNHQCSHPMLTPIAARSL